MSRTPELSAAAQDNQPQVTSATETFATPFILNLAEGISLDKFAYFLKAALHETKAFHQLSSETQLLLETELQKLLLEILPALESPNRHNFTNHYLARHLPDQYSQMQRNLIATQADTGAPMSHQRVGSLLRSVMRLFVQYVGAGRVVTAAEIKKRKAKASTVEPILPGEQRTTALDRHSKPTRRSAMKPFISQPPPTRA